jgi:protocatechuate 3,4-dioxygenase, alpha subunit
MTDMPATTPSQTVGPFLSIALAWPDGPELVTDGTVGAITITGTLTDGAGAAVPDGVLEIWQADPDGRFPHPDDPRGAVQHPTLRPFGRCLTDTEGRFRFRTLKPGRVDGEQAPHIDVSVFARGLLQRLVTRIYFPDEAEANAADPVLRALTPDERARLVAIGEGDAVLRFDVRLQGEAETPFFTV